jgi:hypothetical protein
VKVIGIARELLHSIREQECSNEKEEDRVTNNKKIQFECPLLYSGQPELEPPEMHDREKEKEHPPEMNQIKTLACRVLNKSGHARQKTGDAQTHDDPDNDPKMNKEIGVCCGGVHVYRTKFQADLLTRPGSALLKNCTG